MRILVVYRFIAAADIVTRHGFTDLDCKLRLKAPRIFYLSALCIVIHIMYTYIHKYIHGRTTLENRKRPEAPDPPPSPRRSPRKNKQGGNNPQQSQNGNNPQENQDGNE